MSTNGQIVLDALLTFEKGVNNTIAPELLDRTTLANGVNTTVRGSFVTHRPAYRKLSNIDETMSVTGSGTAFVFQGATYCRPDVGSEFLLAAISGNLYKFAITGSDVSVSDVTSGQTKITTNKQHWLWQSEKWVIWNDGNSMPGIFDSTAGTTSTSPPSSLAEYSTTVSAGFTLRGSSTGLTSVIPLTSFTSSAHLTTAVVGRLITFSSLAGGFSATASILAVDASTVTFSPTDSLYDTAYVANDTVKWSLITTGLTLPPGRMGAYVLGRNWVCLTTGVGFIASDIVGGSSGTLAEKYRNAVLKTTENYYLSGGGTFTVPGSNGSITFMRRSTVLDASLGQGPLLVGTYNSIFSCNAPTDRSTWQNLTYPILSESMVAQGGLGQNSTVNVNSDVITRTPDGMLSLTIARRDFNTWGGSLISNEVSAFMYKDDPSLLQYGSGAYFGNRFLMTAGPTDSNFGVYHPYLVPINFDTVSSLQGKSPSVFDSVYWEGMNVLQIVTGSFNGSIRCFAFCYDDGPTLSIREIMRDDTEVNDTDLTLSTTKPIEWSFETASLDFGSKDPTRRQLKRLIDGEIYVDSMAGDVEFSAYYKPDQWPDWIPWFSWVESALTGTAKFRPRMGLGEPTAKNCDGTNGRPLREAYSYQFRLDVVGHCRFVGAKFKAVTIPESQFAKPNCETSTKLADSYVGGATGAGKDDTGVINPPGVLLIDV